MSKRKETENRNELRLRMSIEDAQYRLGERMELGTKLRNSPIKSEHDLKKLEGEYYKWNDYNTELLRQMFTNSDLSEEYSQSIGVFVLGGRTSLHEKITDFHSDIDRKLNRLDSISDRLELIPLSEEIREKLDMRTTETELSNKRVFLVHGHDESAKEKVARFLEKLNLEVIILHEQVSHGMTIIEKLERYSDVGFSVILLTPDDEGRKNVEGEAFNPRARQNVILELGYFIGKIGRNRVLALHTDAIELPSDYLGVVFVMLDPGGGWRLILAKELKNTGFQIDMNDAL